MKRTEWLQETRKMRFEEAYEGWQAGRLTQEEAARILGEMWMSSTHNGALFGRIQLIRKQASPAGGERYVRLEINQTATIRHLLRITSNPQLDALFAELAT
ncbi:hypothetical protein [Tepidimonas charontis]|uniref:Uncharacterized protein n=1 Tax=Tepidimonas charontis TaxID=2267262 RepID=A0A554X9M2_9BURK|nr:hypothetical protein [Tepidimonas charontis]TSE32486.1 hypothetical protein Tchar_02071 [Tepidimonas charontis]